MKDFLHLWVRHNPTLASYVQIFLKWVGAIFFRNGGALFCYLSFGEDVGVNFVGESGFDFRPQRSRTTYPHILRS